MLSVLRAYQQRGSYPSSFGRALWARHDCPAEGVWDHVRSAGLYQALTKRSPNMTAKWVFASAHSRGSIFHPARPWLGK